jgi:hypothetical protein
MLPRSHPSRIRARLGYQLTRLPVVPTSLVQNPNMFGTPGAGFVH